MRTIIDMKRVDRMEAYFDYRWTEVCKESHHLFDISINHILSPALREHATSDWETLASTYLLDISEKPYRLYDRDNEEARSNLRFKSLRKIVKNKNITLHQLLKWAKRHSISRFYTEAIKHTSLHPLEKLVTAEIEASNKLLMKTGIRLYSHSSIRIKPAQWSEIYKVDVDYRGYELCTFCGNITHHFEEDDSDFNIEDYSRWGAELLAMHEGEYDFDRECIIGEDSPL